MIKLACDLYYKDKEEFFGSILKKGTYRDDKVEERMKKWYLYVAEEKMKASNLPDLDTINKERSLSPNSAKKSLTPIKKEEEKENKNNNSLDLSKLSKDGDNSNNTSKTEIKSSISKVPKIKEDAAKGVEEESKEIKDKREAIAKKMIKEKNLITNMLLYLREQNLMTNDPTDVFRLYRDCKEKA